MRSCLNVELWVGRVRMSIEMHVMQVLHGRIAQARKLDAVGVGRPRDTHWARVTAR